MSKLHIFSVRAVLAKLQQDNNIPAAEKGEEISELLSFNVKYALNTIPKATVSLPVGSKIESGTLSENRTNADSIEKLSDEHTPVGIYVTVKSSDTKPDTNPIKVPKDEFCIFKGFVEGCSYNRDEKNVSITLQLAHWLQVLTIFPLVNTLIDPQCVGTIGRSFHISASKQFQSDTIAATPSSIGYTEKQTACLFLKNAMTQLDGIGTQENIWSILKNILLDGMPVPGTLVESDPGYVSKDVFDKIECALWSIRGKSLDLAHNFIEDPIKFGIADYIIALTEQQLIVQTPWDAMIGGILPSFYMALAPAVSRAYVIPIPGQCMDVDACLYLSHNDYKSVTYNRSAKPMIGGVMLYTLVTQRDKGGETPVAAYRYPLQNKPGPFQFINAPQWIRQNAVSEAANTGNQGGFSFYGHFEAEQQALKDRAETQDDIVRQGDSAVAAVLKLLVKSAYQVLSCQGRSCVVVLPFRADIVPGSQIKIQSADMLSGKNSEYMCGTVSSVNFIVSQNTADTVLELNNLRTSAEMSNPELTSKTGVLFKDAYHYAKEDDEVLYAK